MQAIIISFLIGFCTILNAQLEHCNPFKDIVLNKIDTKLSKSTNNEIIKYFSSESFLDQVNKSYSMNSVNTGGDIFDFGMIDYDQDGVFSESDQMIFIHKITAVSTSNQYLDFSQDVSAEFLPESVWIELLVLKEQCQKGHFNYAMYEAESNRILEKIKLRNEENSSLRKHKERMAEMSNSQDRFLIENKTLDTTWTIVKNKFILLEIIWHPPAIYSNTTKSLEIENIYSRGVSFDTTQFRKGYILDGISHILFEIKEKAKDVLININTNPSGPHIFFYLDIENQLSDEEIIYDNGDVYKGKIKNGKPHGNGVLITENYTYNGMFNLGIKHGKGVQIGPIGFEFQGVFVNDKIHSGNVKSMKTEKGIFSGEIKMGVPDGHGIYKYKNGDKYDGNFLKGTKHGFGKLNVEPRRKFNLLRYKDAIEFYEGDFENDKKNGIGKVYFKWKKDQSEPILMINGIWKDDNLFTGCEYFWFFKQCYENGLKIKCLNTQEYYIKKKTIEIGSEIDMDIF